MTLTQTNTTSKTKGKSKNENTKKAALYQEAAFDNLVKMKQDELKTFLHKYLSKNKYHPVNKDGFLYAEGSDPVLLVAHLDTVHKTTVKTICKSDDGNIIMSPEGIGGDDRCGVFAITEIIKTHKPYVLFCEDEETGVRGAKAFVKEITSNEKLKPDVKFIIEIDRRGDNDAVFYNCDNKEFTEHILSYGFDEQYGSFTDISEIAPVAGVAAVNISSGYYNAHTLHEYVVMSELKQNIKRVKNIIEDSHNFKNPFIYIESKYIPHKYGVFDPYDSYGFNYDFLEGEKGSRSYYSTYGDYDTFPMDFNNVLECGGYVYDHESDEYLYQTNLYIGEDEVVYELLTVENGLEIAFPMLDAIACNEMNDEPLMFSSKNPIYYMDAVEY